MDMCGVPSVDGSAIFTTIQMLSCRITVLFLRASPLTDLYWLPALLLRQVR